MEMTKVEKLKAKIILSIGDWVDCPARTIPYERLLDELVSSAVSEERERIINRIVAKEKFHRKKFKEFYERTNGNVMNGHLIKAETCKEFLSLIKE